MKRNLLYAMTLALSTLALTGCDKDTEGLTGITYYADITLDGETTIILNVGDNYEEPGYSATLNGEDVTSDVVVTSDINTSELGIYTISYSLTNADGFTSSSSRTIYVTQDGVAGLYQTDGSSYRLYSGATTNYGGYYVFVYDNGDGTYYTEDYLGGWYWQRAGYGTAYAMTGNFVVNADNSVDMLDSYVAGWGDSADSMYGGIYDPAGGTGKGSLTWSVDYAGLMTFTVVLNKI